MELLSDLLSDPDIQNGIGVAIAILWAVIVGS